MAVEKLLIACSFLVCSTVCDKHFWYKYQFDSGHGNREELAITKVDAVDNFKTEGKILKWKSLSLKRESYALGLAKDEVTVLHAVLDNDRKDVFSTHTTQTSLNRTITDAALIQYYNDTDYKNKVIAVIATYQNETGKSDVSWYEISSNNTLIPLWSWEFQKRIYHVNVFKETREYYILLCSKNSVDVYKFKLSPHPDIWLQQIIHTGVPVNSTSVFAYKSAQCFSLVVKDEVQIYCSQDKYFTQFVTAKAQGAFSVVSFEIGYKSFVAFDGYNAGIYEVTERVMVPQEIADANLDGVNSWLSISLKTYRDEQVLIAQRALEHGSYTSYAIEVVLYSGGKFTVHDEMTCDYYGDVSNGMNCLVEEDKTHGVEGAAVLVIDGVVGVLVPRHITSGLFMIHTEMKQLKSPLQKQIDDLEALKGKLQKRLDQLAKKSFDAVEEDENYISMPWKGAPALQQANQVILNIPEAADMKDIENRLNTLEANFAQLHENIESLQMTEGKTQFGNLILNGFVEVKGVSNIKEITAKDFNDNFNLSDIVRLDNLKEIPSRKIFTNISVESLHFKSVNNISSEHIVNNSSHIEIGGVLTVEGDVKIHGDVQTGTINDLRMEDEFVIVDKVYSEDLHFENLHVTGSLNTETLNEFPIKDINAGQPDLQAVSDGGEEMKFDSLYLAGNVTVTNINDQNFDDFISKLSFVNIKSYIPGITTIKGNIRVTGDVEIEQLNDLKFPEEYVLAIPDGSFVIEGAKQFRNATTVDELTTAGTVNGVDPDFVVTLSGDQIIPATVAFSNLQVKEALQVDGALITDKEFLSNPTLLESPEISSNANFKVLEVQGNIFVENIFNGTKFFELLDDVVYKYNEVETITSIKNMLYGLNVQENLNIASNSINNVDLDDIITKNTDQVLKMKTLNGPVTFEKLKLTGNYDGVNVVQLEQESVKLSGEQFIPSDLFFENEVKVDDLEIVNTLNGMTHEEFLNIHGNSSLLDANFADLKVENLVIKGNLTATNENFNLLNFNERRLSYSKEQTVPGDFYVETSKIQQLSTVSLNQYEFVDIFDESRYNQKVLGLIADGKLKVDVLSVLDSANIRNVNEQPVDEILKNCISTEENGRVLNVHLNDNVFFEELDVENFNSVKFTDLISNIIYKNDSDNLSITEPKIYLNGFHVTNYITSPLLNNIKVENILRKSGEQKVLGPLMIEGKVLLESGATIQNNFNDVPIAKLHESFKFENGTYHVSGDVEFEGDHAINSLEIKGTANDESVDKIFNNIVNTKEDNNFTTNVILKNIATIQSNLVVDEKVNGIVIGKLVDEIVLVTKDSSIEGPVRFTQPVFVQESISARNLESPDIMGVDVKSWKENAVFINEGKILGKLNFDHAAIQGFLHTKFINNIDMNSLIPLQSVQEIEQELNFGEISLFKDVSVNGLVNGRKLEEEYFNTVMNSGLQGVNSRVVFLKNVLVRNSLNVLGRLNDRNVSTIVTLDSDQHLNAFYKFENRTVMNEKLSCHNLINGKNFTEWLLRSVRKQCEPAQKITNNWDIHGSLSFDSNVIGEGLINGLHMQRVVDQVESRRVFKYTVEHNLIEQYRNMCKDINTLVAASKQQIYLFQYIDNFQYLGLPYNVANVHSFVHKDINYILTTSQEECQSTLFFWSGYFKPIVTFETGIISQIISVYDEDFVYLVTRNDYQRTQCSVEGGNIWKFQNKELYLLFKIENLKLLHESAVPGTFFGMDSEFVWEYRLVTTTVTNVHKVRKWAVDTENAAFVPRYLKQGPAISNGRTITRLNNDIPINTEDNGYNYYTIVVGNTSSVENHWLPGKQDGELIVLNVGYPKRRTLVAVATQQDYIRIYEDAIHGVLFSQIPANKPSSLTSLEFGDNGETLLLFLENEEVLQVYEYKGIEGFKQRSSAYVRASKLVPLQLPLEGQQGKFIAMVDERKVTILQAVMVGDQIGDEILECTL